MKVGQAAKGTMGNAREDYDSCGNEEMEIIREAQGEFQISIDPKPVISMRLFNYQKRIYASLEKSNVLF